MHESEGNKTDGDRGGDDIIAMPEYRHAIIANSQDAISVLDENGVCEYVNDAVCRLVGWPREELVGQHFAKVSPPELYDFYRIKWEGIMAGTQWPYEGQLLARDGTKRWVHISSRKFTVGGKVKCCSIAKDITELKATQQAIQRANENLEIQVACRTLELNETIKARDSVIEALRQSETKHRELVENCGFVVATFSCDGRVLYGNSLMSKYLGRPSAEVIGMHVLEALGPDMGGKVLDRLKKVVKTGKGEDAVDYVMTPEGPRWTWGHPSVNLDSDGKPYSVTIFLHDITQEKEAELKLVESEGKYRELVESCGFMVITYGCDGRIRYVNSMGAQLLGRKVEDVVGRHVIEAAGPEVGEKVAQRIRHLVETGEVYDDMDEVETPIGRRWMWGHPSVTCDANGKPEGVTVFLHDITELKLAEMKLAKSEADYRMLVNYAGFVVVHCDLDGTIRFMNDMGFQYVNRKPQEVIGKNVVEVWWQTSGEAFMGGIRRALEKGKDIELELYMAWQNPRWFWSRYNIMRDPSGKPESIVFFAHDITTQKLAEMKLKESEENFRTFFESMTDMVIVGTQAGRILFTNAAATRMLGYSAEELAIMHVLDVHQAGDRREAEEIFAAIFRGERQNCPLPLARKDGGLVPVETRVWLGRWNGQDCVFGISKDLTAEQEAQQRFEHLFRHNPALMVLTSLPENRCVDVNDSFVKRLGYSRDEAIGKTAAEVGLLVDPEKQAAAANKMLAEGHIANIELQVRHKDGTILDGLFSGEIISNQGRQYFLTVMIDITESKLTQAKLHESEARYQQLIETAGISITCFDRELRITLANRVSAARYQMRPEEIIGKRLSEVVSPPWGEAMEGQLRQVLETGRVSEREVELVFPVGRRWFWSKATPLHDASGKTAGAMVFAHDITEQKLAQVALHESENRRRMLTEMAMEGIFMHEDGILLEANPRYFEMFGYRPEELLGKQARDITVTGESLRALMENLRTGDNKRIQVTGVRKDGSQFPCEVNGLNAVYKGRNVRIAVAMDISDRVKAETEVAQMRERMAVAERLAAVGYMGATMAHEINTPLSVMKLSAQMLISDIEKSVRATANKDHAQAILNEIDHASEIVRRYRDMSRPARNVSHNASDVPATLEGVINLLQKTAERAKMQLLIGPRIPEFLARLGSIDHAEQLLLILIENAIQAADGKTWRKLKIDGCLKDGNVEIRFIDDCCGIPPENLQKIFEPFFSTKPRNVGTGLGLSIVRRLLQERGGQIKVESKVGEGTTFIVTYPA